MSWQRTLLTLGSILCLAPALALTAQQPAKQAEVSPKILAFLKAIEPAMDDSELVKKLKERHNAGVLLLEERIKEYQKGTRDIALVFEAARLVVGAKLDLTERPEDRIAVLKQTLAVARLIENHIQKQLGLGFGSRGDVERARFSRLSVEVELLKTKEKGGAGGSK
jgi:hypothetical protein